MSLSLGSLISIVSLGAFIYFGNQAHWFDIMRYGNILGYNDPITQSKAVGSLIWLVGFIMRNEFDQMRWHK